MSDNRAVARGILEEAIDTIIAKRPGVHGSAEQSFNMIAAFWNVYIHHVMRARYPEFQYDCVLEDHDVAEMMSLLKKARKVYGDPLNRDNDVDDAGYTSLAGMLRLPDPERPGAAGKPEKEPERQVPRMVHTGIDTRPLKDRYPEIQWPEGIKS